MNCREPNENFAATLKSQEPFQHLLCHPVLPQPRLCGAEWRRHRNKWEEKLTLNYIYKGLIPGPLQLLSIDSSTSSGLGPAVFAVAVNL